MDKNLLKVSGRVQASLLDPDEKHLFILPYNCQFFKLLIGYFHDKKLHGGIRITHSIVRQKFLVVKAKRMIRSYINKCNICIRYRADTVAQKMGILPAALN